MNWRRVSSPNCCSGGSYPELCTNEPGHLLMFARRCSEAHWFLLLCTCFSVVHIPPRGAGCKTRFKSINRAWSSLYPVLCLVATIQNICRKGTRNATRNAFIRSTPRITSHPAHPKHQQLCSRTPPPPHSPPALAPSTLSARPSPHGLLSPGSTSPP